MKSNYKNNKKKIKVTIKNLLANDFHIGEEINTWHPSMNASVLGSIDVIPLTRTLYSKKKKIILKGRPKVAALENLKKFTKK
jgi:ribosomal protein S2